MTIIDPETVENARRVKEGIRRASRSGRKADYQELLNAVADKPETQELILCMKREGLPEKGLGPIQKANLATLLAVYLLANPELLQYVGLKRARK